VPDPNHRGFEEWIDQICGFEFYKEIPRDDKRYHVGQFFTAHVIYPFARSPKVLELEQFDANDEMNSIFRIAEYDTESENQRMRPIKQLNLRSTDRLYISTGKVRPVILLKIIENSWMEEVVELALCLPIASFKPNRDKEIIIRTQLFDLPQYFYIKPSEGGAREESAARFDLLQYICLNQIKPVQNDRNYLNFKLSPSAFKIMVNHLSKYLFGKPFDEALEQEIGAFRDILLEDEKIRSLLA
jgi:hypothetical protein